MLYKYRKYNKLSIKHN